MRRLAVVLGRFLLGMRGVKRQRVGKGQALVLEVEQSASQSNYGRFTMSMFELYFAGVEFDEAQAIRNELHGIESCMKVVSVNSRPRSGYVWFKEERRGGVLKQWKATYVQEA